MTKTLDEIFAHHFYINSVNDQISKARENRKKIIEEAQYYSLKSDAFSSLEKRCKINPINLADEYILIYEKRSGLPSRERDWISRFVGDIILQAIVYFDKLEKEDKRFPEGTEIVSIGEEHVIISQESENIPKVKKSRKKKTL